MWPLQCNINTINVSTDKTTLTLKAFIGEKGGENPISIAELLLWAISLSQLNVFCKYHANT